MVLYFTREKKNTHTHERAHKEEGGNIYIYIYMYEHMTRSTVEVACFRSNVF